jgi:hypothetical protein
MNPELLNKILKKQGKTSIVVLDDTDNPPKMDEQTKNIFFNGRHDKPIIMMPTKQEFKLYDDYNNFAKEDIERILNISNDYLIDWLLDIAESRVSKNTFILTKYHKQTITAIITKIECGIREYNKISINELIETLINFWNKIKECIIDLEQLKGIISDNIIESSIVHVCFRKHFYDEDDAIAPTSSDIQFGLSKLKNPYYIKKMNEFVDLYNIDI